MEPSSSFDFSSEFEDSNLENKVDEVDQNVYNLSNQQVDESERQMEGEEKEDAGDQPCVELQTGLRILKDLMADSNKNVNWPFMDPIAVSAPDLVDDYNQKIDRPIWLKLMKDKFVKHEYTSITEFVSDFRLMLENCYRYNGPDHYVSKRGQKLETMLEQKLALLSRDLRAKTSIAATSGHLEDDSSASSLGLRRRQRTVPRHDSTLLLNQLREEELQREREYRRQVLMDRKAEKEALALEVLEWEDKVLFQGKYKEQMKCMWELPQIGLFLFLCHGPLNVGEVMQLELERCIMVPRESSTMQLIMTSLLSTPFQRLKIDKKTLMPYKVWNEKLRTRLQQWYKIYSDTGCDAEKACVKLGFEPDFFRIVGQKNPMERKRFHEISFYRRVWIVKGLCDYCMLTQDCLRETVEIQPYQDQREYMLGTDGDGWRYLHFPQFCGADVRIYKQAPIKYPKIEIKPDPFDSKRKFPLTYKPPPMKKQKVMKKKNKLKKKHTPPVSPVTRLRPAGLRQTPKTVIPLQLVDSTSSSSSEDDYDDDTAETESQEEMASNHADTNEDTNEAPTDINEDEGGDKDESETDPAISEDEKKSAGGHSTGSDATIPYCDNSCSDSVSSSRSCSRASSPCFTQDSVSQDTRFDSSRENSASPMIYGHMLRKFRNGARLKDLPNSRAARNLNSFLFMEDSNSRSSEFGDNSNSGILSFKGKLNLKDIHLEENNSSSSGVGDNSTSCDMKDLFKSSLVNSGKLKSAIHASENEKDKPEGETGLEEDMNKLVDPVSENECNSLTSLQTESEPREDLRKDIENVSGGEGNDISSQRAENNLENKENIETSNESHEQVLFKNSNGFINRSETVIQDRKKVNKNLEENKIPTLESAGNKESNGKISDTDLQSEVVSCDQKVDSKNEKSCLEDTDMKKSVYREETEIITNMDNDNEKKVFAEPVNSEIDSGYSRSEDNKHSLKMEVDDVLKYGSVAQKPEDMEGTSQTQLAQNSEISHTIKQEAEEGAIESQQSNQDDVRYQKDELNLEEKQYINEDERVDISKVKAEIDDTMSENMKTESDCIASMANIENMDTSEIKTETEEVSVKEEKLELKEEKSELKEEKLDIKEEEDEEITPDMGSFKLIVDSVDGLRELTKQFEEQEPIVIKRGKKEQVTKPPPRKRCVVLLHNRLSYLLKELEPWESKLNQATKRARIKLRKEVEDYIEKEEEEPHAWDTDEETESGSEASANENEVDADKHSKASSSPTKLLKGRNSECSTPVKFEESSEEIDISQRGRLRKRRIIPNNVEDQNPVKKSKTISKSDSSQHPLLVQKAGDSSGKITIGYSELIRQLKAVSPSGLQGTNSPILLQTSQGGKVLVTSIVPTGPKANQNIQNLTLVSQSSASASQPVPITMATTGAVSSVKQSQHPTIQHLLAKPQSSETSSIKAVSALLSASSGLRHILPQTTGVVQGVSPSVIMRPMTPAGNQQTTPVKTPVILKPNTSVAPQKLVLSYSLSSQKVPASITNSVPVIPQQVPVPSLSVITTAPSVSVSPGLLSVSGTSSQLADSTGTKGKLKYYAANASTLPINVVQQLLATRGAKLQTGPNQQSILFIPMESEGSSRSVISVSKAAVQPSVTLALLPGKSVQQDPSSSNIKQLGTQYVLNQTGTSSVSAFVPGINFSQTGGSQNVNSSVKVVNTSQAASTVSLAISTRISTVSVPSASSESVNSMSLPTSNTATVSVQPTAANTSSSSALPVTQMLQIQTDLPAGGSTVVLKSSDVLPGSSAGVIKTLYGSPPKYPTNETVRTLLFKRKSSAEEKEKGSLPSPDSSIEKSSGDQKTHGIHFQKISPKPPALQTITVTNPVALQQLPIKQVPLQQFSPNQNIVLAKTTASPILAPALTVSNTTSLLNVQSAQQCVFTSISASKLNTLLLQTSAAGAKSIPSLIKLPSKAALDSAVKAVVTSVNITLPTVNIKVPSPTSLPSIGPRRNVTKTIQTMKSPIPVAPKVVTQSSCSALGTTVSVANSNMIVTSSTLPLVSIAGQTGALSSLTSLIPVQQIQSSSLPVVTLAGQSGSPASNLLQAVRAQLGSTSSVSLAGQTPVISAPIATIAGQGTGQATNLIQSVQSLVQNIDGKNVLTKMIPQTILTSQGLVQGYITPQGIVIPQAKKLQTSPLNPSVTPQTRFQATLKQEIGTLNQGGKTVSAATSPSHLAVSPEPKGLNVSSSTFTLNKSSFTPTTVQYIKPGSVNPVSANTTALSSAQYSSMTQTQANSIPLIMPVPQLKSPALPSGGLSVTPAVNSTSLKSPQQTGKFIFPPNLSGLSLSATTPASVSPLLNIPTGVLVPGSGGLQVASPLLSQLSLPVLQSGMAVQSPSVLPQNLNLLQTSLNPTALQQLVNPVLLTPGMISSHLLSQNSGLQTNGQNVQTIETEHLPQNNTVLPASQAPPLLQKVMGSNNEDVGHPSGQVLGNTAQVTPNITGINSGFLKQINAAALVKQLASSQLQTKVNVVNCSVPDVKPVLLQQQLNTPSSQTAGLKLATPMVQNLAVPKQSTQLPGQVKVESGKIVAGGTGLSQAFSIVNPSQSKSVGQPLITPISKPILAAPKTQTNAPAVSKAGSKTIAVNQITNEVVTPVCANPSVVKQIQGPSRVIAVNKKSNKLEEVFPQDVKPAVTQTTVGQGQNKPVMIKPLKSPETVQNAATGSQQKIMLFSIGGQLVTQQGVPVTLENGVLKLMPQAIVQIANQTLTPKQIQQTLAKISQATFSSMSTSQQGHQSLALNVTETLTPQPAVSVNTKVMTCSPANPDTQTVPGTEALNRDHTYETQAKLDTKGFQQSFENILPPAKKRPSSRVALNEQLENRYVTVPNITSTAGVRSGSNSVQFVLKPMVTSGYIVCPRMSGVTSSDSAGSESEITNAVTESSMLIQPEIDTKVTTLTEGEPSSLIKKSEKRLNVNGERGTGKNKTSDADIDNDDAGDDLSETPLVIDTNDTENTESYRNQGSFSNKEVALETRFNHGSYMDKEAALNLLRLANQALGSSDEGDDKDIDNAGDASNKLGR